MTATRAPTPPPPRTGEIVQPHAIEQTRRRRTGRRHTGIVARAEPEREDGLGGDIRPQPRELDSDAELGLTVLAPGIALFALIAIVAQFAHPV